ncbi:MAG TPA: hypothetical protein VFF79_20295 [Conexibacter sp.]|nr:hypothetical protein [Conexibacter sp.]
MRRRALPVRALLAAIALTVAPARSALAAPRSPVVPDGPLPAPPPLSIEQATDFRVQTYRGRPVLTWWQGNSHEGPGHGQGVDCIADSS